MLYHLELKQVIILLFGILMYIVAYISKNIKRLKVLLKYKKEQVDELEMNIKQLEKDNCFGDIYFFEDYLVKLEMHYFEIIKYDDILWIFKRLYYYRRGSDTQEYNPWLGYKTYGELIFITKDKKIHQMGYINKEEIFKNKILEKNSNIFF